MEHHELANQSMQLHKGNDKETHIKVDRDYQEKFDEDRDVG